MENVEKPLLQLSFKVRSYETDFTGNLKPESLFHYFQESAHQHANLLGVGFQELSARHVFWVLSRLKIEVKKLPRWEDEITVSTWPKGFDRFFALRDFILADKNTGEPLILATSGWVIVDLNKRRLLRIEDQNFSFPHNSEKHALQVNFGKMTPLTGSAKTFEHKVTSVDIDIVQHVNNGSYLNWIMACYDYEFFTHRKIKEITVHYLEEAKYGDDVLIHITEEGERHYCVMEKKDSGNKVMQAMIEFGEG